MKAFDLKNNFFLDKNAFNDTGKPVNDNELDGHSDYIFLW